MSSIKIHTSKKKSVLLLIASLAFVAGGIWMLLDTETIASRGRGRSPIFIQLIGVASILFFGVSSFIWLKRIVKSQVALIIDSKGLNVNPRKSLTEFIKWQDILSFEEVKIQSTYILIIHVSNPDYWLEKETNVLCKKLMQFNMKSYHWLTDEF